MELFTAYTILTIIFSYLIGSVPTAIWVGRKVYGVDIREHGSKNAGATNTFRVLGKKAGIPVLLFDIFKGWAPVYFFSKYSFFSSDTNLFVAFQLILGLFVVIGHIFPLYAKFKGGKGVASLLGVVLAVHLPAALVCFCVFVLFFLFFRMVSLGAILGGISFPIVIHFVFNNDMLALDIFSVVVAFLLLITHKKNIRRILKGEENKMNLRSKK